MRTFSRSKYRVWLRVYIKGKTLKGYPFFKFRLNSANWQSIVKRVERMGYKVNSVYREAKNRKTDIVEFSERLI